LKSNEEFRASVYARAEGEKLRLAAKRTKMRNASLSVAMVLVVAALAVPLARITGGGPESLTEAAITQDVIRSANRAAAMSSRMVLVVATPSGQRKAVVLEDKEQQKDFANQYKLTMDPEEGEPAAAIHSADELTAFLAGLPEAAEAVAIDYDEAFFADNDLYAMPMLLATQPDLGREESTTVQHSTIPDANIPSNLTAEMAAEEGAGAPEEHSHPMQTLPEQELLQGTGVQVLLLVPVNKG